jgi:hypothetical protein
MIKSFNEIGFYYSKESKCKFQFPIMLFFDHVGNRPARRYVLAGGAAKSL